MNLLDGDGHRLVLAVRLNGRDVQRIYVRLFDEHLFRLVDFAAGHGQDDVTWRVVIEDNLGDTKQAVGVQDVDVALHWSSSSLRCSTVKSSQLIMRQPCILRSSC